MLLSPQLWITGANTGAHGVGIDADVDNTGAAVHSGREDASSAVAVPLPSVSFRVPFAPIGTHRPGSHHPSGSAMGCDVPSLAAGARLWRLHAWHVVQPSMSAQAWLRGYCHTPRLERPWTWG